MGIGDTAYDRGQMGEALIVIGVIAGLVTITDGALRALRALSKKDSIADSNPVFASLQKKFPVIRTNILSKRTAGEF